MKPASFLDGPIQCVFKGKGQFSPEAPRELMQYLFLHQGASFYGEDVVLSFIEFTSSARRREEILELLRYCADGLQAKPGCLGTGIYEAGVQNETILYLERWMSAEELHRHIQSNLYLGVLAAMDLASGPPDVRYYEVSETKSMELIAALRGPDVA